MSLKIWLPLTEDTKNQGLLNLPTPSDARTRDTGGKLGQYCYSDNAIYHIENEWLGNEWSLACWVKSSSWSQYNDIILCKNTTSADSVQFYLSIRAGTQLNIGCNAGFTTLKINYTFATDTWYHVAATYDGATLKLYLNGSEIGTKAYISTQKTGMNNLGIGCRSANAAGTSSTGGANKRMNDVRIYDHALSPMEVKQISQGLILHYPLNRGGFGVDNILLNTHFDSRYTQSTGWDTTKNGTQLASSWGGYNAGVSNSSTVYHAHLKEFNGEWVYEYIRTANETWLGISQGGLNSKLIAGKTYTFSWEEYRVEGNNYPTGGLYYFKTGATSASFHLGQFGGSHGNVLGKWRKFSYTFVAPTNGDYSKNMSWYIYGNSGGNGKMYIRHPKLEEGSIATPWCPNSSDVLADILELNDDIEYDCSGYQRNGTKINISYSNDTPKYNVSSIFNSASPSVIKIPASNFVIQGSQNMTISIWAYMDDWTQYTSRVYSCTQSGGFNIQPSGNNLQWAVRVYTNEEKSQAKYASSDPNLYVTVSKSSLSSGWHMFTWTYTTDGTKIYVDGQLKMSREGVSYGLHFNTAAPLILGGEATASSYTSPYFDGKMSDFRIYSTALSPQDILSLYNNEAYIDNNGNIYGAVYEEA